MTLDKIDWASEPNFEGREFTNSMYSPQAQIHIERGAWGGPWLITVANSEGFLWNDRIWPGSQQKSLREAVKKAVKVARESQ